MKTSLFCLALLIVALIVGQRQQAQINALELRLAEDRSFHPVGRTHRERGVPRENHRTKHQNRSAPPSASDVYQTVLSLLRTGRSVMTGSGTVMQNREAFRAIVQLDLAGQKELIRLIARSSDPKFSDDPIFKCEQINLCLCAMADRHPETALAYLRHSNERIGKFFQERIRPEPMEEYIILRLCDHDPQAGLDALVEMIDRSSDPAVVSSPAQLLAHVGKREPERVLDTIRRLPMNLRPDSLRAVLSQADSTDECTRMFQLLRQPLSSDPVAIKTTLTTLCQNIANREKSWDRMLGWLEDLELGDTEKLSAAFVVGNGMHESAVPGKEMATRMIDFLPPSKERDYLVWRAMVAVVGSPNSDEATRFLNQQGIDHGEMLRLDRDGFLQQ